jgi:hypothetical protein
VTPDRTDQQASGDLLLCRAGSGLFAAMLRAASELDVLTRIRDRRAPARHLGCLWGMPASWARGLAPLLRSPAAGGTPHAGEPHRGFTFMRSILATSGTPVWGNMGRTDSAGLAAESPAFGLGFEAIERSAAGPRQVGGI